MSPQVTAAIIAATISLPSVAVGAWSALVQVAAVRRKTRLDLYDRRYALYRAFIDNAFEARHLTSHHGRRTNNEEIEDRFQKAHTIIYRTIEGSIYLFGSDYLSACQRVRDDLTSFEVAQEELWDAVSDNDRTARTDAHLALRDARQRFGGSIRTVSEIGREYMDFTEDRRSNEKPSPREAFRKTLAQVDANRQTLRNDGSMRYHAKKPT